MRVGSVDVYMCVCRCVSGQAHVGVDVGVGVTGCLQGGGICPHRCHGFYLKRAHLSSPLTVNLQGRV